MGVVIVVASGKGGTGKTSFVAGVGSCLAALGHRTLCLDGDISLRNLDLALGLPDAALSFYDLILDRAELSEAAVEHPQIKNLFLLTAPVNVTAEDIPEDGMKDLTSKIREEFEFCLIDAPAGIGSGFTLAADSADMGIIISNCDTFSLRDTREAVLRLECLKDVKLVVNRVKRPLLQALANDVDDIMDYTGLPLLGLIPDDEHVTLSANRGKPLILCRKNGAALAYLHIALRMLGKPAPLIKFR